MGAHNNKAGEDSREEHMISNCNQKEMEKTTILPLHDDQSDLEGKIILTKGSHRSSLPFPRKLHNLLEQADKDDELSHIISWQPHGASFMVRKPEILADALYRYTGISRKTSFYRLLSLHGFQTITRGADKGAYCHENFLRANKCLASKIVMAYSKRPYRRQNPSPGEGELSSWPMSLCEFDVASQSDSGKGGGGEAEDEESTEALETSSMDSNESERQISANALSATIQSNDDPDDLDDETQVVVWGRRYYTVDSVMSDPTWNSLLLADWDEASLD